MNNKNNIIIDNEFTDAIDENGERGPSMVAECDAFAEYSGYMSLRSFVNTVTGIVSDRMGDDYSVSHNTVSKNNSVSLEAISILRNGRNIAPNIYLEKFYYEYLNGKTADTAADEIIAMYYECMQGMDDSLVDEFSFEGMKDRIMYRPVNYEMNRAMLENIPHIRYLDLAVTFCCLVRLDGQGMGTIRITNEHMKSWGVDVEQLLACARANSERVLPHSFRNILDVLSEMMMKEMKSGSDEERRISDDIINCLEMRKESDDFGEAMYVLGTECGINGAACLFYDGLLKSLREKLGCGFYILPSSVNEVIIIPDVSGGGREIFESMVPEVNREKVPAQDVLSDRVYHYPEDDFVIA